MPLFTDWPDLTALIEEFDPTTSYADDMLVLSVILFLMFLNVFLRRKRVESLKRQRARHVDKLLEGTGRLVGPAGALEIWAEWFDSKPLITITVVFPKGTVWIAGTDFGPQAAAAALIDEYHAILGDARFEPDQDDATGENARTDEQQEQKSEPAPEQEPRKRKWWEVLGVSPGASKQEVQRAYRSLALKNHPDHGGSSEDMAELNAARDEARGATT